MDDLICGIIIPGYIRFRTALSRLCLTRSLKSSGECILNIHIGIIIRPITRPRSSYSFDRIWRFFTYLIYLINKILLEFVVREKYKKPFIPIKVIIKMIIAKIL